MFTLYDYRWYNEGKYIAFLQREVDSIYNPYLTASDDVFVTPETAQTDAILVRYTVSVTVPTSETTDFGVSREIGMALEHYVKYRMKEDTDINMSKYHYRKFRELIFRHMRNLKGATGAKVIPSGVEALK
jgi:hypothetical protein